MRYDLTGNWTITANQVQKQGQLPGTLHTNGIGHNDKVAKPWHPDIEDRNKHMEKDAETDPRINSRFTRLYTYEGEATFQRTFDEEPSSDKRLFIVAERARALSLNVDGANIPSASGCLTFSKLQASFTKEAPSPSPATTPIRGFLTKTLSFPQQPQMRPRLTGTE